VVADVIMLDPPATEFVPVRLLSPTTTWCRRFLRRPDVACAKGACNKSTRCSKSQWDAFRLAGGGHKEMGDGKRCKRRAVLGVGERRGAELQVFFLLLELERARLLDHAVLFLLEVLHCMSQ